MTPIGPAEQPSAEMVRPASPPPLGAWAMCAPCSAPRGMHTRHGACGGRTCSVLVERACTPNVARNRACSPSPGPDRDRHHQGHVQRHLHRHRQTLIEGKLSSLFTPCSMGSDNTNLLLQISCGRVGGGYTSHGGRGGVQALQVGGWEGGFGGRGHVLTQKTCLKSRNVFQNMLHETYLEMNSAPSRSFGSCIPLEPAPSPS